MNKFTKYCVSALTIAAVMTISSCTTLDEKVESELTPENFPATPEQFIALSGPAFTPMRSYPGQFFNLSETGSDELIVPTRGGDWADGGNWKNMHMHDWTPTLGFFNDAWGWLYGGIANCNRIIETIQAAGDLPGKTQTLAEVTTQRAFYYFLLMDLFGRVPIVTEFKTAPEAPEQKTRTELYNFIVTEVNAALPNLSADNGVATYGRPNKWMAQALLAKMALNGEVYTGTPKLTEAEAALNVIISSGKFDLEGDFIKMFKPDNGPGVKEAIYSIPFDAQKATSDMNFQMRTLHYKSRFTFDLPADPWNGFCTLANFYSTFNDANDQRNRIWLAGPQYASNGTPLTDNAAQINFTPNLGPSFDQGGTDFGRSAGVRNIKYYPDSKSNGGNGNNDYIVFRYGDVLLMKAEVLLRKTAPDAAGALLLINQVRTARGAAPLAAATLTALYDERGRELAWESW
ncbi:MAG TPA: RagB/SusD family nutrient uptake outer membrane protein, partial [Flavitalea sp.]|nr:RagB/SusD family nutrient uptake outer membrane protein [Flavitalea sp.]